MNQRGNMKKYLILCLVLFCSQIRLSSQVNIAPYIALSGSTADRNVIDPKHEEQYHNSTYEVENLIGYFVMKRKNVPKVSEYVLVKRFQIITYYSCGQHMLDYREECEYIRHATEEEIKTFKSVEKCIYVVLVALLILLIAVALIYKFDCVKTTQRT